MQNEAQQCKWLSAESFVDSNSHTSERKEARMSWASPGWFGSCGSCLRHSHKGTGTALCPHRSSYAPQCQDSANEPPALS